MDSIRSALISLKVRLDWLPDAAVAALMLALAVVIAFALDRWVRQVLRRLLARRYPALFSAIGRIRGLTQLGVVLLALIVTVPVAPLDDDVAQLLTRLLFIAIIAYIGWAAMTALHIAAELYLRRFRLDTDDNLLARKHNTQVRVLLRATDVLLVLLTVGAALMTFQAVRQYGVSLFASAGVAGIIAGFAARPVISNLFAGVQLAMTQPIRIGDAVIVENESGTIEDITSTYVVVRLWDWRHMIVPLTYFIEKPFQNWTRETAALIGSVFLYVDYRAPVGVLRAKFEEIVRQSRLWDGRVLALQVTDAKEQSMELRCLMSAQSASQAFDLRCEVREKLIDFLQREHPEALPRQRTEGAAVRPDAREQATETKAGPKGKAAGRR